MSEPTASRAKFTLSALQEERTKSTRIRRADFESESKQSAARQQLSKLFESRIAGVGPELEGLRKQAEADSQRHMERLKREAETRISVAEDVLKQSVENWRNTVQRVSTLGLAPLTGPLFLLDTANEISSTSGINLSSTHIGPQQNTLEFQLDTQNADGTEAVSFGFLWQNPRDKYVVVNVDGYLVLNGICQAIARGGLVEDGSSRLSITSTLNIHELWNDPPTSPVSQPGQSQSALELFADATGWFYDSQINDATLFRGYDLQYELFLLPPNGVALFEVGCSLYYQNTNNGQFGSEANFVFRNLGRQVLCDAVLVGLLS